MLSFGIRFFICNIFVALIIIFILAARLLFKNFSISISRKAPTAIELLLLGIWLMGILVMLILVVKSGARLHQIKQSALLLQNQTVRKLYYECLEEMDLHRNIPTYLI